MCVCVICITLPCEHDVLVFSYFLLLCDSQSCSLCICDSVNVVEAHYIICDRFEQHVHFSKDRTKEHSQWKAAEFSQELLLVPVPVFNRSTLKH